MFSLMKMPCKNTFSKNMAKLHQDVDQTDVKEEPYDQEAEDSIDIKDEFSFRLENKDITTQATIK